MDRQTRKNLEEEQASPSTATSASSTALVPYSGQAHAAQFTGGAFQLPPEMAARAGQSAEVQSALTVVPYDPQKAADAYPSRGLEREKAANRLLGRLAPPKPSMAIVPYVPPETILRGGAPQPTTETAAPQPTAATAAPTMTRSASAPAALAGQTEPATAPARPGLTRSAGTRNLLALAGGEQTETAAAARPGLTRSPGTRNLLAHAGAPQTETAPAAPQALFTDAWIAAPLAPVLTIEGQRVGERRLTTLKLGDGIEADFATVLQSAGGGEYTPVKLDDGRIGAVKASAVSAEKPSAGKAGKTAGGTLLDIGGAVADGGAAVGDHIAGTTDKGKDLRTRSGNRLEDHDADQRPAGFDAAWDKARAAEIVSGGFESAGAVINVAQILRSWKQRNTKEKAEGVFDMVAETANLTAGVTKIVDSATKIGDGGSGGVGANVSVDVGGGYDTTQSDLAGKVTGNVAGGLGLIQSVKETFTKGKGAFEAWRSETASRGEKVHATADAGLAALGTLKASASVARDLFFTLTNTWDVTTVKLVPGLGAAISGLKLIITAYDLAQSVSKRNKMRALKGETKRELGEMHGITEPKALGKLTHKDVAKWKGGLGEGDDKEAGLIDDYELYRDLQTHGGKNVRRQIETIAKELVSLAGSIASLTGYGATVGLGLGAANAGYTVGKAAAMSVRQYGRDHKWKGFDANKSTSAKAEKRRHNADQIFDRVIALGDQLDGAEDARSKEAIMGQSPVPDIVRAAGLSWKAFMAAIEKDPDDAYGKLVAALGKRG